MVIQPKMDNGIAYIRELLSGVLDPEVPALSIEDLGILRDIKETPEGFEIVITPTFTGCPAMKVIEESINEVLSSKGINNFSVKTILAPAWTTDWMTEAGKKKLKDYGIAPPSWSTEQHLKAMLSGKKELVACPFCDSVNTRLTSAFGSTACKALHYCDHCHQPFEEFKCH